MPGAERDDSVSPSEPSRTPGSLRGKRAVSDLFHNGRRVAGRHISLIYRESADGNTRYVVLVPRRLGGSVRRNRARRVLREFIRTHPHTALNARETIILCKQSVERDSLDKAIKEIGRLLDRMAGGQ